MIVDKEGKQVPTLPNGDNLIETNQHYVLIVKADGSFEPAVIPMSSSQLRSSRIWNALMKKVTLKDSKGRFFTPASYYMTYALTTIVRTKDQNSWYIWNVEPNGPTPTRELYEAAKAFEQAVAGGTVKVKVDESAADTAPTSKAAEGELVDDESIPF
jgi:hypothetical protein